MTVPDTGIIYINKLVACNFTGPDGSPNMYKLESFPPMMRCRLCLFFLAGRLSLSDKDEVFLDDPSFLWIRADRTSSFHGLHSSVWVELTNRTVVRVRQNH